MQKLTFTMSARVNSSYMLTLNSTVFHTLNTSGVAPVTYPFNGPAEMPGQGEAPAMPVTGPGDTLLLWHNGHFPTNDCWPDYDGVVDWANQVGVDVMSFQMPLYECNSVPGVPREHSWFAQWAAQGVPVFRFFLEPVVRAVNYAINVLGYKRVIMSGLSGGGWTTTMLAAIDPRITLSMPIAGSMPCDFAHTSWDFEQWCDQPWANVANYTSLYVLAGLEAGRASVQIIHEQDPCCFHGCGRHARIREYNAYVQSQIAGAFATAVTPGAVHEANPRDKVLVGSLISKLTLGGGITQADLAVLPFNVLNAW